MTGFWPWLAVAGVGALHGLNPVAGWMLAAGCGLRAREPAQALRALVPIAFGHVLSVLLVAAAVASGLAGARAALQAAAAALLGVVLLHHLVHRGAKPLRVPARRTGLALWSFIVATGHGAGLMLVPALAPLCIAGDPARAITASGSLVLALAAAGVHAAAMLAVSAAIATGACRAIDLGRLARVGAKRPHPAFRA